MVKSENPKHVADEREVAMAACATVELFGDGAVRFRLKGNWFN
jgi:hypothetical protein